MMVGSPRFCRVSLILLLVALVSVPVFGSSVWRSELFPEDWVPGFADSEGRFLQDFSFAGYHAGMKQVPQGISKSVVNVTQPPYSADNTGITDATEAIQRAIDDLGTQGGGTVYLPPGTYGLTMSLERGSALAIRHSNVQLIGAGTDKTFLRLDSYYTRGMAMILVEGQGNWRIGGGQKIAADLTYPTQIIPLEGTPRFNVGDWVILNHDVTDQWLREHFMDGWWGAGGPAGQVTFYRQIIDIDWEKNAIIIDVPIRYMLLTRDGARVTRSLLPNVEEVGLAHFSVGMVEHPGTDWGNTDYNTKGTAAYDVHNSAAIRFVHATNSWIDNIHSYMPEGNRQFHVLSHGVVLQFSRFITVQNTDFRNPQYRGAGANGYNYLLESQDSLLVNTAAYNGRHNYTLTRSVTSGNVIANSYSEHRPWSVDCGGGLSGLSADFHMHFSPSNLIDNMTLDQDHINAAWRVDNSHYLTTGKSVIWNTNGIAYAPRTYGRIITSEQSGWGYVIGTRGPASNVRLGDHPSTLPTDYVEGVGQSDTLAPQSLYLDQLARRQERGGIIHTPDAYFLPPRPIIKLHWPTEMESVKGLVKLDLSVELPRSGFDELKKVEVLFQDEQLYSGSEVPDDLYLDTLAYSDGRHELRITATTEKNWKADHVTKISVKNWWRLTDTLEAPLEIGWFGALDSALTSDKSSGWEYATGDDDDFFHQSSRMRRRTDTREFLEWESPKLAKVEILLYTRTPDVSGAIEVIISPDKSGWAPVPYRVETRGPSAGGWYELRLTEEALPDFGANWFRLEIREGAISAQELQIGSVDLQGFN